MYILLYYIYEHDKQDNHYNYILINNSYLCIFYVYIYKVFMKYL